MLKFIAHDTVNDIALIKTSFVFWVRYGLQQTEYPHSELAQALEEFAQCQRHAVECQGEFEGDGA